MTAPGTAGTNSSPIAERLKALEEATRLSEPYLPADSVQALQVVAERAKARLRHGTHHTVVALAGPTGAGKSTLFNALVGEEVSVSGVRRPTTSKAHACVFGEDADGGAAQLLDWLSIGQRYYVPAGPNLAGLILVDLPDHDSTEESNRVEVDRLIELVDLMIWVVDPQKYADHALHEGYLRPLAGHGPVMRFVLSKADTLDHASLDACIRDFTALLAEDGIADAQVVATSLDDQAVLGAASVESILTDEVNAQRATVDRLSADLRRSVDEHLTVDLTPVSRARDERSAQRALIGSLGKAAGVQRAADTVAEQHRLEAHLQTGWPMTRWASRFRRRPIRDLPVARTSTVASAEVALALRAAGESAASGMSGPWAPAIRRRAEVQHDAVLAAIDTVSHRTISEHRRHPRWWGLVGALQWLLIGIVAVGVAWLVALAMVNGFFRIDVDLIAPNLADVPLPTVMVFGGIAVGVVLSLLSRLFALVGARRRARQIRSDLDDALADVAHTYVEAPLMDAVADRRRISEFANTARGA